MSRRQNAEWGRNLTDGLAARKYDVEIGNFYRRVEWSIGNCFVTAALGTGRNDRGQLVLPRAAAAGDFADGGSALGSYRFSWLGAGGSSARLERGAANHS